MAGTKTSLRVLASSWHLFPRLMRDLIHDPLHAAADLGRPIPDSPHAALNAGFVLGVTAATQKKDCALEFIEYASSTATNLKLITTTGSGIDPVRISSLNDPSYAAFNSKVQAAAATALNGALAWPTVPAAPKLFQELTDGLSALLDGQGTPAEVLAQVNESWKAELGG